MGKSSRSDTLQAQADLARQMRKTGEHSATESSRELHLGLPDPAADAQASTSAVQRPPSK
jgi:hypothetical protein